MADESAATSSSPGRHDQPPGGETSAGSRPAVAGQSDPERQSAPTQPQAPISSDGSAPSGGGSQSATTPAGTPQEQPQGAVHPEERGMRGQIGPALLGAALAVVG